MTAEQKAKAYDEALEKLRKVAYTPDGVTLRDLEEIFPELKESEDERIRKRIIQALHGDVLEMDEIKEAEIWLEKQGEQKSNNEFTFKALPRLLDMIEPTDRAKAYCKKLIDSLEKEGYTIDAKIVGECLKGMNGEKVSMATMDEQEPADKVEPITDLDTEFKRQVSYLIASAKSNEYDYTKGYVEYMADALLGYAKKELQSVEWSKEDGEHIKSIISTIEYCKAQYPNSPVIVKAYTSDLNWLKSLRHQPQWKPTKKQIMALRWVLNHIPYDIHKEEISGLFDQIKEL